MNRINERNTYELDENNTYVIEQPQHVREL